MKNFSSTYPNIAEWIELGQDDYSKSLIRALDEGGIRWESKAKYKSLDDALDELEIALEKIIDV
jgi:hypothetical protein